MPSINKDISEAKIGDVIWVEDRRTRSGRMSVYGKIINIFGEDDDITEILVAFDDVDKDHDTFLPDQLEWYETAGNGQWRVYLYNQAR